jgi:hypothetical protein
MENAFKEVAFVWILTHASELRFGVTLAILSWAVYTRSARLPPVRCAICAMLAATMAAGYALRQHETVYPAEALWSAAADGNSALVTRLVRAGADPNAQIDDTDALQLQIVRSGDDADTCGEDCGTWVSDDYLLTPLQVAINNCHSEAVQALIDAGADVNCESVDLHGERYCSPIYIAGGRPQIIHELLMAGAWNLADDLPPDQGPAPDWTGNCAHAGLVGAVEFGHSVNFALPDANWRLDPDRVHAVFAGEYHHAGPIWKHTTTHDGWYLTSSGDHFDYQYGFSADNIIGGVLPYRNALLLATKVGHVDGRTLERESSLAAEASRNTAAQAPARPEVSDTYTISAFVRGPGRSGAARQVVLYCGNISDAAAGSGASVKLVRWLRTVHPG